MLQKWGREARLELARIGGKIRLGRNSMRNQSDQLERLENILTFIFYLERLENGMEKDP